MADESFVFQERTWAHTKDFTDSDTGITIRVNHSESASKYPGGIPMRMYSFELIRAKGNSTRVSRYFPIMITIKNGRAVVDNFPLAVMNTLIAEAEAFCETLRQEREDKITAQRLEREQAVTERVTPQAKKAVR